MGADRKEELGFMPVGTYRYNFPIRLKMFLSILYDQRINGLIENWSQQISFSNYRFANLKL